MRALIICAWTLLASAALAADRDEFAVKREAVFEFAKKPRVTRRGDRVTVSFETKGYCDATVAVENSAGRIVRHLASGVLGKNAPPPFKKDSKRQGLVWDGKDDQGRYIDDKKSLTVRVSLGLKPRFERTLFWSPHKRISESTSLIRAAPEGVYVYDGQVLDHLRLFDHDGNYLRTVYPFPAGKLKKVRGLEWHSFIQDGKRLPLKGGYHQAGLLTSGTNNDPKSHAEGRAASALAVASWGRPGPARRVALAHLKLNRLATDGTTGGLPLEGPRISIPVALRLYGPGKGPRRISPWSAEFSPDGKRLYLAGFTWTYWDVAKWDCLPAVMQLDYEKNGEPRLFAGSTKKDDVGKGPGRFHCATSVACDAKGRVYVSDYVNDRIQVFTPGGKLIKIVKAHKPAVVRVHQKTGEIFVFSWPVHNVTMTKDNSWKKVRPTLTHLGPLKGPRRIAAYPLPLPIHGNWWAKHPPGPLYCGEIDSWTDPPAIWISTVRGRGRDRGFGHGGDGFGAYSKWERAGIKVLVPEGGKLVLKRDFGRDTAKSVVRAKPPILSRQRLYVNPATGKLYIAEGDSGVMKSVNQLVEVEPRSGKTRLVNLPMGAEDLCFDLDGLLYLRTDKVIARYDSRTWREIPFDYGEERRGHGWGMGARTANLISALPTPGHRSFNFWHLGGIDVSVKGHILVTTCNGQKLAERRTSAKNKMRFDYVGKAYSPPIYPGRMRWGEIHVYDKHGKKVVEDAVPGMGHLNGIGIDKDDNIYTLAASRRLIGGKRFDPKQGRDTSGTVVKVRAKKARVLSTAGKVPVPLPVSARPKRPAELQGYTTGWVQGAEWFYGGVGFSTPGGCVCWNSRFDLDYFNRSFAPEPLRYGVAVLDSNGNLITRVGRPGNVDDGVPLVPHSAIRSPNSVGGDEVALFYACYVAAHTDKRLFIADAGNARIVSVKLGYHAEERIGLKDVPDLAESGGKR